MFRSESGASDEDDVLSLGGVEAAPHVKRQVYCHLWECRTCVQKCSTAQVSRVSRCSQTVMAWQVEGRAQRQQEQFCSWLDGLQHKEHAGRYEQGGNLDVAQVH